MTNNQIFKTTSPTKIVGLEETNPSRIKVNGIDVSTEEYLKDPEHFNSKPISKELLDQVCDKPKDNASHKHRYHVSFNKKKYK